MRSRFASTCTATLTSIPTRGATRASTRARPTGVRAGHVPAEPHLARTVRCLIAAAKDNAVSAWASVAGWLAGLSGSGGHGPVDVTEGASAAVKERRGPCGSRHGRRRTITITHVVNGHHAMTRATGRLGATAASTVTITRRVRRRSRCPRIHRSARRPRPLDVSLPLDHRQPSSHRFRSVGPTIAQATAGDGQRRRTSSRHCRCRRAFRSWRHDPRPATRWVLHEGTRRQAPFQWSRLPSQATGPATTPILPSCVPPRASNRAGGTRSWRRQRNDGKLENMNASLPLATSAVALWRSRRRSSPTAGRM